MTLENFAYTTQIGLWVDYIMDAVLEIIIYITCGVEYSIMGDDGLLSSWTDIHTSDYRY